MSRFVAFGLVALCLLPAACGTPVSVERRDAREVQAELTRDALTSGRVSEATTIVLRRQKLLDLYSDDPAAALKALHQAAVADSNNPALLFALAEMAFLQGEKTKDRSWYLGSALYAFAFLFPQAPQARPNPFDPRLRTAADLYNLALTRGLASADGQTVDVRAGDYPLPFGTLSVTFDPRELYWAGLYLSQFIPAAELHIKGMNNRYRQAGIGAPLAADIQPTAAERGFQITPQLKIPATALLRPNISPASVASGRFTGRLTLYPGDEVQTVEINGQTVPLESEPSAALAYALSNPEIWESEIAGFLKGDLFENKPTQLAGLEPYHPGRIPVVLIHGTASSPGRWGDLVNDLQNDPAIRDRFQFWLFTYNTGNPVPISALQLRNALEDAVRKLDPRRRDPAMRNMVLIGHSQGGLLAKMLVINSGSRLFDGFSQKPLDQLRLKPETRDLIQQAFFVTPMPDVTRVIFIATPHRGSFVAGFTPVRWIARLVILPLRVTLAAADLLTDNGDALRIDPRKAQVGSLFGMTPGSPLATTLPTIPVAPGITAHSIIAVKGGGPVETGDDGVVKYSSAHIDEAASELVVRSGHSVQSDPQTVAEVRRILLLQLQKACPHGCAPDAASGTAPIRRPMPVVN